MEEEIRYLPVRKISIAEYAKRAIRRVKSRSRLLRLTTVRISSPSKTTKRSNAEYTAVDRRGVPASNPHSTGLECRVDAELRIESKRRQIRIKPHEIRQAANSWERRTKRFSVAKTKR